MEKENKNLTNFEAEEWRVGPKAFVSLVVAILFFSGMLTGIADMKWLSAFDYSTLAGKFGTMKTLGKDTFVGAEHSVKIPSSVQAALAHVQDFCLHYRLYPA